MEREAQIGFVTLKTRPNYSVNISTQVTNFTYTV